MIKFAVYTHTHTSRARPMDPFWGPLHGSILVPFLSCLKLIGPRLQPTSPAVSVPKMRWKNNTLTTCTRLIQITVWYALICLNCPNFVVRVGILGNFLQATNAALDFYGSTDLVFKENHPLQPPVCLLCDLLVCQLSPLQVGAVLDFSGMGDWHGVYFAEYVYNKGM